MAEYIEREALIKACKKIIHDRWNETTAPVSWSHAYADFIDDINNQPAADVAPVRHGRWLKTDEYPHRVYCSECYATYVTNEEIIQGRGWQSMYCTEAEFCPHCGAKMDGDKNEPISEL